MQKVDQKRFKVVSMFSGCGGMDLGFLGDFQFNGLKFTRHPFEIIWANDINVKACSTYRANLGHKIHHGDVSEKLDLLPESTDVLIGGFPCQDISVNGRGLGILGKRSGLYRLMVEAIKKTKPKIFVAENVGSFLNKNHKTSLDAVMRDFRQLGYKVEYKLIKTVQYGVPQTRERIFFVGRLPEMNPFEFPELTTDEDMYLTASDVLSDLVHVEESPEINHIWSKAKSSPDQGSRRLKADRPGYTIRAECHGNIHFHYLLDRRMSMREAARIQSFPDSFIFSGGIREIERQIGNAVPPVFAWHLAGKVADALGAVDMSEISSAQCA